MSKRNFILLIIILTLAVIAVFGFFYFRDDPSTPEDESGGTNFLSQFNPFGTSTTKPPVVTPPVDVSGGEPTPSEEVPQVKLMKVSSMPVAGFGIFLKERLKEVPVVTPPTPPAIPYNFGSITLKNGSTGEAVKEIQRFLNDTLTLGLELDGILDAEVVVAIKQWQGAHGLVADGVVGPKTKATMYASVNQKTETVNPTPPPTEFVPALRYVEKATGNIYQTFADKIQERKFSGTTIPKVYDAYFGNRGESVVMRYLKLDEKTIETFVGTLPKERLGEDTAGNNEVKGTFLPENVRDLSVSPDAEKIFYLFTTENSSGEGMIGTTLNFRDGKKVQIFDSAFTEWLSGWGNANTITLSTKPSGNTPGYAYSLNPVTRNLNKVLGDTNGLTVLGSPNGKLILFADNNLSLYVYNTDTRNSELLGVRTLPEKCVWGTAGTSVYCAVPKFVDLGLYPDTWYQGEVSFFDQIWKIDLETGSTSMLVDPITISGGEEVDGIKLSLDGGENFLFFVNKKDSFLWKLNLK